MTPTQLSKGVEYTNESSKSLSMTPKRVVRRESY